MEYKPMTTFINNSEATLYLHMMGMQPKENTMQKFTKEQAIIVMGFTGKATCNFGDFQEDVEKRLGHPVCTHQFGNKKFADKVKELYKEDFIAMCVY